MVPVAFSGNPFTPSAMCMTDVKLFACNRGHVNVGKPAVFSSWVHSMETLVLMGTDFVGRVF